MILIGRIIRGLGIATTSVVSQVIGSGDRDTAPQGQLWRSWATPQASDNHALWPHSITPVPACFSTTRYALQLLSRQAVALSAG